MWSLDILALDGLTTTVTDATFKAARLTWALDGSGAAEIELTAADALAGAWLYGRRRVLIKDSLDVAQFQGWLDRLERRGAPGKVQYRASARGLAAILEQRVVHGDFNKVSVVATTIARDLIAHMVAQTNDMTGFTAGTHTGAVSPARDRWYCDGDNIREMIDELAELSNGFTWEIDAAGAFNTWAGQRGTDLTGSVTLRPEDVQDWSFIGDMEEFATYATGVGEDPDGPCGPPALTDYTADRTAYGRREAVIGVDTASEAELLEAITEELRARAASGKNLRVAWIEGRGPWAFGDVWLGDTVNVELGPEFGGDADMRLINVSISLEPGTLEFVELEWEAA